MKARTNNIIIAAATLLLSSTLMSGNAAAGQSLTCKYIEITAVGSSAGGIARLRNRRAERRAKSDWTKQARQYGPKYSYDNAIPVFSSWGQTSRGNPKLTIKAYLNVCI